MKTSLSPESITGFIRRGFRHEGKHFGPLLIITIAIAVLLVLAAVTVLFAYLIQWMWSWLVPDLFPALVKNGSLAGSISWWTAFKVVIAIAIITSLFRSNIRIDNGKKERTIPASTVVEPDDNDDEENKRVFPALVDPLTDRELEVLELLAKGLTNQQIALQLNISESTVVYHIGHIFGKLRVSSRVEAAVWAKERGII